MGIGRQCHSASSPLVLDNFLTKYNRLLPVFNDMIDRSFLSEEDKDAYKSSIASLLELLKKDFAR